MSIAIRDFMSSDKEEIFRLFDLFGDYFVDIDDLKLVIKGEGYAEYFYEEMVKNVTSCPGKIYVAEDVEAKRLAGFIAGNIKDYYVDKSVETKPHIKGRVLDLFVDSSYRGMGVGKNLMEKIEIFFKDNNCDVINIEVFAPNGKAYNFYKSFGYRNRNIDLIKVLK